MKPKSEIAKVSKVEDKGRARVNETSPDLATVAAGVAAVIGSGVGLAGLMEYLKSKYPKVYAALSDLGSAANDSRTKGVNESLRLQTVSESLKVVNEADVSKDKKDIVASFYNNYIVWSRDKEEHQIRYGKQAKTFYDDMDACHDLGECIRHYVEAEGLLD